LALSKIEAGCCTKKRAEQEQRPRLTAADNGQPDGEITVHQIGFGDKVEQHGHSHDRRYQQNDDIYLEQKFAAEKLLAREDIRLSRAQHHN